MQLHQLKPIHKREKVKRVGRGGKRGTTSGRGTKGQSARAGSSRRPALRDLIKKLPKLRGEGKSPFRGRKVKKAIVNLETLERYFQSGDKVTPQLLAEKGLINKIKGNLPEVKLLGAGELTKKLLVEDCQISKSAKLKLLKVGGEIK